MRRFPFRKTALINKTIIAGANRHRRFGAWTKRALTTEPCGQVEVTNSDSEAEISSEV
jgi:hypothetical protein